MFQSAQLFTRSVASSGDSSIFIYREDSFVGSCKPTVFFAGLFFSVATLLVARPATAATVYEQARAACASLENNQQQYMQCVRDQMQARTPTPQQGPAFSSQTPQYNQPSNSQLRTRH